MSERKYTLPSIGPRIDAFLRPVLTNARLAVDYQMFEDEVAHVNFENPDIVVKFKGRDVDLLLANKAELLLALEQLTMEALRVPFEDHSRISFDANDYRRLRIEELRLSAGVAAEKVKRTGVPFAFNPMNSRERRVIHLALRNEAAVRSESTGFGGHRKVVIYPAGMPSSAYVEPAPKPGADRGSSKLRSKGARR